MTPSLSPEGKEHFVRACRLLGLLLPPPNRRKLQLLLKFVRRVASNPRLRLDGSGRQGNLSLALSVLSPAVLRPYAHLSHDAAVGRRAAALFAQMYEEVWTPVEELRKEVEEKVRKGSFFRKTAGFLILESVLKDVSEIAICKLQNRFFSSGNFYESNL